MTCTDVVCGTGGWSGPRPGDPDNAISLSAVGRFGAIEVSWTYPSTNAFAVSHFRVFRGTASSIESAMPIRIASGSSILDKIEVGDKTRYYYWVLVVSIHGTESEPIGPASAISLPVEDEILSAISGRLNVSMLDADLRAGIMRIPLMEENLSREILDRVNGNASLAAALSAVQSSTDQALTYIYDETVARASADEAMVSSIQSIAAGLGDASAAIVEEKLVRATKDDAMASQISILYSGMDANAAAILAEKTTRVTALDSLATSVTSLTTTTNNNTSAIQSEVSSRTSGDTANATAITNLQTRLNSDVTAINSSISSINTSLSGKATSTQLNTLATTVSGQTTTIQQHTASIDGIQGKYTVKIDNNGYVSGFGLISSANNGTPSSAFIIRADSFALVMPGYGNYVPFAIGAAGVTFNGKTAWDNVTGISKPENNATNGAVIGGNLYGTFDTNNISTFMPSAVIGNAQIKNAAVDTLTIAGNAVTVPSGATGIYSAVVTISMSQPGYIMCIGTFTQGSGKSGHYWRLLIDAYLAQTELPIGNTTGAMSGYAYVGAGTHTCTISCDTKSGDGRCGIVVFGIKR